MFLKEDFQNTIVVSKSEFITYLRRCKTEKEYKDFVGEIKKKHYDANHCCSGFVAKDIQKSSDDGEPSKTAGVPILNAIINENMEETAAVVVRYFGGVKLGASGLIRTYRQATVLAIKNAPKIIEQLYPVFQVKVDYELANKLSVFLRKHVEDLNLIYGQDVTIEYMSLDDFKLQLENIARRNLEIIKLKDRVVEKEV